MILFGSISPNLSNLYSRPKNLRYRVKTLIPREQHDPSGRCWREAGLDYGTEALSGRIGTSVENTAVFYVYTYDSDPTGPWSWPMLSAVGGSEGDWPDREVRWH